VRQEAKTQARRLVGSRLLVLGDEAVEDAHTPCRSLLYLCQQCSPPRSRPHAPWP
jgi:hypothetical protein